MRRDYSEMNVVRYISLHCWVLFLECSLRLRDCRADKAFSEYVMCVVYLYGMPEVCKNLPIPIKLDPRDVFVQFKRKTK